MKLKQPTAARRHHLQWTHHGGVFATYFVEALDYGLRQPEDKAGVADAHESLVLNCPENTVLLSLQIMSCVPAAPRRGDSAAAPHLRAWSHRARLPAESH